jgi:hypothetical protein
VPSAVDNAHFMPSVAQRNADMALKQEEEDKRPPVIAEKKAREEARQRDAQGATNDAAFRILEARLLREAENRQPAVQRATRIIESWRERRDSERSQHGLDGEADLTVVIEKEVSEHLGEIAKLRDEAAAAERMAAEVAETEKVRLSAAGMSAAQTLDWLEGNRFVLRRKGDSIQIAPIGGVSLREKVALKMHYAGILALLKNRENFGTVDAIEN